MLTKLMGEQKSSGGTKSRIRVITLLFHPEATGLEANLIEWRA